MSPDETAFPELAGYYASETKPNVEPEPTQEATKSNVDIASELMSDTPTSATDEPTDPKPNQTADADAYGFPTPRKFGSRKYVDPDESLANLIGKGALERGGQAVIVSQSGVGKSSFAVGMAAHLAAGVPYLDNLRPGRAHKNKGLRALYMQAENSDNKSARAEDGVSEVWEHGEEALQRARRNLAVITIDTVSGDAFAEALDHYLTKDRYDLVIVDPLFAYYGGDVSSQKEMSHFFRNMVQPVLSRHGVGLLWIHHTNKPRKGDGDSRPTDQAYAGSGSAELTNVARCVITLEATKERGVFLIRGAKNGGELDMHGEDGKPIYEFHAAYFGSGKYAWRLANPDEIEAAQSHSGTGRPPTVNDNDLVLRYEAMFPDGAESVRDAARRLTEFVDLSESRIRSRLTELKCQHRIQFKAVKHPAEVD